MSDAKLIDRRSFLCVAAGAALTACGADAPAVTDDRRRRVLLAYFSRAGENYHYGARRNLRVGNTEGLARMISQRLQQCDVCGIEAVARYPADYEATVQRNVREQDADARRAIVRPPASIDRYDAVI